MEIPVNSPNLLTVEINGIEKRVPSGTTVLLAARGAGVRIPTLCHDDRVEPYSGCGLCLVEAEGARKPIRACSTAVADGMKIRTDTPAVIKMRRAQLGMLISDHEGDCKPPCHLACPGKTDCQGYVGLIANGMYGEALALIMDRLPFPGSLGRVCPHPCETECRRKLAEEPIGICSLKRFAADSAKAEVPDVGPDTGFRVAVVGGGPAGLSAAYFLRRMGHAVTVYDELPKMGGMFRYGIPEYRLPKAVLDAEIEIFSKMGIELVNGVRIGRDVTLGELRERFDRVFVGVGAGKSARLGCPGEDLRGVLGGVEFLRSVAEGKLTRLEGAVAVVGGGDTAMDACRTAVRLGADPVYVVYRRTVNEMPANAREIEEALEEGVIFKNLRNPLAIEGEDGAATGMRLQVMELGEPDESGRRAPVPVIGQEETLRVSRVIVMIGQTVDAEGLEELEFGKKRTISANGRFETSVPGVYAAGDAVNKGPGIAIEAIGAAREAAEWIDRSLRRENNTDKNPPKCGQGYMAVRPEKNHQSVAYVPGENSDAYLVKSVKTEADLADREKLPRENIPVLPAEERKAGFAEAAGGLDAAAAWREAARCLECGCMAYYDCKLLRYAREYGVTEADAPRMASRVRREADAAPPYFTRDMNKCVLCRLCVRVCDEVEGRSALGVANRGFDTYVLPELGMPLSETNCSDCGMCVAVCPTGALADRNGRKRIPLPERRTVSVCGYCGVGCQTEIATYGGLVTRVLPAGENGLLCVQGRYGFIGDMKKERVLTPMLREKEKAGLIEADFGAAYAAIQGGMTRIGEKYGKAALAVGISGSLTDGEIAAAMEYAGKLGILADSGEPIGAAADNGRASAAGDAGAAEYAVKFGILTDNGEPIGVAADNGRATAAGNVFRLDAESAASVAIPEFLRDSDEYGEGFAGLAAADVIVFAEAGGQSRKAAGSTGSTASGSSLSFTGGQSREAASSTGSAGSTASGTSLSLAGAPRCEVARLAIKKAAANGAKLILLNAGETYSSGWAGVELRPADLSGDKAEEAARAYAEAENAVIVLDWAEDGTFPDGFADFLRQAAGARGRAGKRRQVLRLLPEANSRRLNGLNVAKGLGELREKLRSGEIKGLVLFGGEERLGEMGLGADGAEARAEFAKPEFLAVAARFMTGAAAAADVVLPAAAPWETSGTVINAAGEARRMNAALAAAGGRGTERIIRETAEAAR
ncbi:MAG: FAD-dependent oxidoreductase [Firmicutes bacterium]|nr:FAD-dependent oxidoreductase [Bacillota bacterium]